MNNYTLKDIFLGKNDGKKEALYRSDFEKYFFDYQDIYQKLQRPENF